MDALSVVQILLSNEYKGSTNTEGSTITNREGGNTDTDANTNTRRRTRTNRNRKRILEISLTDATATMRCMTLFKH